MSTDSKNIIPVTQPIENVDLGPQDPELLNLLAASQAQNPQFSRQPQQLGGLPWPPPFRFCRLSFPKGCYRLDITTSSPLGKLAFFTSYKVGTLRVENNGTSYVISGDTYRYSFFDVVWGSGIPDAGPSDITIFPRNRYGSYLQATSISIPRITKGDCVITLDLDEYDYTQPPAGSFDGTFPTTPSRSMTIYLTPATAPAGYSGPYFTGQVYIGGVLQANMSVTLAYVSSYFRKASIEIHTMTGAIAPAAVPASGGGTEYFDTVYAKANWKLDVITDPNQLPAPATPEFPAGWTGTSDWGARPDLLHRVMTDLVDYAAIDLDKQWYMHVLMVQASLGDGRGIMFDTINVPREGVASFSDDGYPTTDSLNFGTAANQLQRNVPRAFLRSASHEITHGFNQIHQENEGGADNSIMTTSPGVANSLAASGQSFPNDIFLGFNDHVRHHLIHLPDIVVRPGGMTFTAGHNGIPVPQADTGSDELLIEHPAIKLDFKPGKDRVKIGEPLELSWELTNISDQAVKAPNNVGIAFEFAEIRVTKPGGTTLDMPPYFIMCDSSILTDLKPNAKQTAKHNLFWSTQGFAFETPGKHTVQLEISWGSNGAKVGASATADIYVDYPVTERDNDIIAKMMHDEVGKYIALGGHASHLKEAVKRIGAVLREHEDHPVSRSIRPFFEEKPTNGKAIKSSVILKKSSGSKVTH